LAVTASALVLAIASVTIVAALAFEHLGGYAACPLCLEQRYAY
jgi:disulfide bond formation protein DsbB